SAPRGRAPSRWRGRTCSPPPPTSWSSCPAATAWSAPWSAPPRSPRARASTPCPAPAPAGSPRWTGRATSTARARASWRASSCSPPSCAPRRASRSRAAPPGCRWAAPPRSDAGLSAGRLVEAAEEVAELVALGPQVALVVQGGRHQQGHLLDDVDAEPGEGRGLLRVVGE